MYRLVALNLAWSGWYRLSESFHSPAFRGIAALSRSAQMSDKINAKEANHCYLLMRSLLPPSCAGTFYTSPRCRAKAEALGVQCSWVFQRKFGGWWPLRHTWKDINPRHPPARGRGEDGELGELPLSFHRKVSTGSISNPEKAGSPFSSSAGHNSITQCLLESCFCNGLKKKKLANWLLAYLGA